MMILCYKRWKGGRAITPPLRISHEMAALFTTFYTKNRWILFDVLAEESLPKRFENCSATPGEQSGTMMSFSWKMMSFSWKLMIFDWEMMIFDWKMMTIPQDRCPACRCQQLQVQLQVRFSLDFLLLFDWMLRWFWAVSTHSPGQKPPGWHWVSSTTPKRCGSSWKVIVQCDWRISYHDGFGPTTNGAFMLTTMDLILQTKAWVTGGGFTFKTTIVY